MRFLLLLLSALLASTAHGDPLLITEVIVDPQLDHSESAGGNGVPYDEIPGSGTVSTVDEYVELFNASSTAVDLRGYSLDFLDTSPSRYVFGESASGIVLRFTKGSGLDALAPGGYVVLGNPPGSLNNDVTIELRAPGGALVDLLDVVGGGASGPQDEAVARRFSGSYVPGIERTAASPLGPPPATATPEPSCLALVALSLLSTARATARTARRGGPRRCS